MLFFSSTLYARETFLIIVTHLPIPYNMCMVNSSQFWFCCRNGEFDPFSFFARYFSSVMNYWVYVDYLWFCRRDIELDLAWTEFIPRYLLCVSTSFLHTRQSSVWKISFYFRMQSEEKWVQCDDDDFLSGVNKHREKCEWSVSASRVHAELSSTGNLLLALVSRIQRSSSVSLFSSEWKIRWKSSLLFGIPKRHASGAYTHDKKTRTR